MSAISSVPAVLPASIPSPEESVWHLGPLPIRAYALCIVVGIIVAMWLGTRRWVARGGSPNAVSDIALWAVPLGIIGARIYHVITDNQLYFGEGGDPSKIFEIWEGGIGIWGAVAGGALGAWIGCRRHGIPFLAMADALAPGVLIAQGIGRWGNWFNNELYGRQTDLPWGLEIHSMENGSAEIGPDGEPVLLDGLYHPTFLYESLWAFGVALLLLWADRRFQLGHGRVLALYVAGYTLGRSVFEYLRIDPANEILGLRVNQWVSGVLFVLALVAFVVLSRTRPGRESPDELWGNYPKIETGTPAGDATAADTDPESPTTSAADTVPEADARTATAEEGATADGSSESPVATDTTSDDAVASGKAVATDTTSEKAAAADSPPEEAAVTSASDSPPAGSGEDEGDGGKPAGTDRPSS